jgi:hypothetical protein
MSQSGGFDWSKMSTASRILIIAGAIYIIDLFLPWQSADLGPLGTFTVSGVHGIGVLNLLLAIALVAWEVMAVAGVEINAPKSLVSAALAGGIVLFTISEDHRRQRVDRDLRLDRAHPGPGDRVRRLDALAGTSGLGRRHGWRQHRWHRSPSDARRPTGLTH